MSSASRTHTRLKNGARTFRNMVVNSLILSKIQTRTTKLSASTLRRTIKRVTTVLHEDLYYWLMVVTAWVVWTSKCSRITSSKYRRSRRKLPMTRISMTRHSASSRHHMKSLKNQTSRLLSKRTYANSSIKIKPTS